MRTRSFFIFFIFACTVGLLPAQNNAGTRSTVDTSHAQSGWVRREIINGDTIYLASIRSVRIVGPRTYKDAAERDRLYRYRRYAAKVYPYAVQAITLYDELQDESLEMSKREHKKFVKKQKKAFKNDFEDRLKQLYKTEGYILIKMIERQTGESCYDIVKETRGTVTATYWNSMGKIWGYNLKEGYRVGQDPLLDEVLLDYDFGDSIYRY